MQFRGFVGGEDAGVDEGGEGPGEGVDGALEADDAFGGVGADVGVGFELRLGGFPDVEAGRDSLQFHVFAETVETRAVEAVDFK